jgi:hypothetical protein
VSNLLEPSRSAAMVNDQPKFAGKVVDMAVLFCDKNMPIRTTVHPTYNMLLH